MLGKNLGRKQTEETNQRNAEAQRGKKNTEEQKQHKREAKLQYAMNHSPTNGVTIGNNEKQELDDAEVRDGVKIDRKFSVIGYKPDGYCHETNTIYEVYEPHHFKAKNVEKDAIRQKRIVDKLHCDFTIIADGFVITNALTPIGQTI